MLQVVRFEGQVIDRQTLLDGTREFSIDAAGGPEDGGHGWQATLTFRWPKEAVDALDEGDLSLTAPGGSSLYGTLRGGTADDVYDEDTASEVIRLALDFEVRSGDGAFAGSGGSARVSGDLLGDHVLLTVSIEVTRP